MPIPELTGRTLAGYRIGEPIGRGASGMVFRARQVSLDREVAFKVLDPAVARDAEAARRFDREGRSAARLDHPAVVDVYQSGVDEGWHFLAMRLINGPSLDKVRLDGVGTLSMVDRMAGALDHAHQAGIVHRDVKPANILLERGDPERAWLGDFGIAVALRGAGPLSTAVLGTAAYMAPEQADPARIGPATDQYALACVAYQCLTGRLPFDREDILALLLAHTRDPVPSTGSAALDGVFDRALAKQPEHRYGSVREFAAALRAACVSPPVAARPMTPGPAAGATFGRPGRSRRRRWAWTGLAAVVLVGLGVAGWLIVDANGAGVPAGWTAVSGPGPVSYAVPGGWQRGDAVSSLVTYLSGGTDVLLVGAAQTTATPAQDLASTRGCADPVSVTLGGRQGAECRGADGQVAEVSLGNTLVRFVFTANTPATDVNGVLNTVTFTG